MSNTAQLVELEGGRVGGRPWGQAFAAYSRDKLSGQIAVVDGDRTFIVAFAQGTVVGARSPLAADAAVRVARLANVISPTQVSTFVRKHGASPIGDDVDLIAEHARLTARQAMELRRKVIAHRAARTFSIEAGKVMVEAQTSIDVVAGCELDPRAIIYQGARQNLSEHRLITELARLGSWFRIEPNVDVAAYGFGDAEAALLDRLRSGGSLPELETCAPGLEARMVRAALYALCVTDACADSTPQPVAPVAVLDDLPAPRTEIAGLPAPRVVDLDRLMAEPADLPAPRTAETRERSDTILDTSNKVDLVGVTVDGRYVLDRKLGEGAMGAVYLAHHTKLDRMFAVKVLHRRLLNNTKSRRRFEREAELTGRLSHHNVVRIVDVGTIHDLPYLAMEFAEGASLATVLVDAPLPAARAIHLLRQLCAGLHHAHEAGLVHRDLKPTNVIVESNGEDEVLRIVDFGIAILNEPEGGDRLTTRGVVLGTPDYMAPELALGKQIDHRLDLYALGVIAYEMFSGVRPFAGDGVDIALANVNVAVPAMRDRAPNVAVDPRCEALVRSLLEKDPEARPKDAQEVRRLLDLIEKDRPAAESALGLKPVAPPPEAAPPPAEESRANIKTRAMWQLKREGLEPIVDAPSPSPPATMRVAAVPPASRVAPAFPVTATNAIAASGSATDPVAASGSVAASGAGSGSGSEPVPIAAIDAAPLEMSPAQVAAIQTSPLTRAPVIDSPFARPPMSIADIDTAPLKRAPSHSQPPPSGPTAAPPPLQLAAVAAPPSRVARRLAEQPFRPTERDFATDEIRPIRSPWPIVAGIALVVAAIVVAVAIIRAPSSSETALDEDSSKSMTRVKAPSPATETGVRISNAEASTPPAPTPAPPATSATPTTPTPAARTTTTPAPATPPRKPDTSVAAITSLYKAVGSELVQLTRLVGTSLTADLTRRYRLIYFSSTIQSGPRRAVAHGVLTGLQREIRAMRDAGM